MHHSHCSVAIQVIILVIVNFEDEVQHLLYLLVTEVNLLNAVCIDPELTTRLMVRAMAKMTSRSLRIHTTLTREAGLGLELELQKGRDPIQHSRYSPAFNLLGMKCLVASPHHSSILFPWANPHPVTSPLRSSYPEEFGPSSP
jgi:hypothetical protein